MLWISRGDLTQAGLIKVRSMIETDRLISPASTQRDDREEAQDRAIRPKKLADYVGQPKVSE